MIRNLYRAFCGDEKDYVTVEEAEILRNSRRRGIMRILENQNNDLSSLADKFLETENSNLLGKD